MPVILGGGIGGLSAAYYLSKRLADRITLYEASNRLGGWIRTENHAEKGYIFEAGPRTIRPKGIPGANTLELIEDLGLQSKVNPILSSHPAARNRMIYADNQLCLLPNSLMDLVKPIPPFTKPLINAFLNDIKAPTADQSQLRDESIYDFVRRRFGTEIAEYAISPMICGICAGDAREISVRFLMNDIFEAEQKYGGVVKGMLLRKILEKPKTDPHADSANCTLYKRAQKERWSIYSLEGGLEVLPSALVEKLESKNVEMKKNAECQEIFFENGRSKLRVNGEEVEVDHIVSALPSNKLAELLEKQHATLAAHLTSIPLVDVAVVNVQYDSDDLIKNPAFGFLVPPNQRLPILGIIFDSCCLKMTGNTVLTVMMGGKWFPKYFGTEPKEDEFLSIAISHIKDILKIDRDPTNSSVKILRECIPQYTVGHRARVQVIRDYISNKKLPLSLCGSCYDGVGVNDVILSAKNAASTISNV